MLPNIDTHDTDDAFEEQHPSGPEASDIAHRHASDSRVLLTVRLIKPNKEVYNAERDRLTAEIDALRAKYDALRDQIALASNPKERIDRQSRLRAELASIRIVHSENNGNHRKTLTRLKKLQDKIQRADKDLQISTSKTPFQTVIELDAYRSNLETQIESGRMSIVEEKRALREIARLKPARRAILDNQEKQAEIEAEKAAVDALEKQQDDPEAKAISERYNAIRAELDQLQKENDEAYANKNELITIQSELDDAYARKFELTTRYREANNRYWQHLQKYRAKCAEAEMARAPEEEKENENVVESVSEKAALEVADRKGH